MDKHQTWVDSYWSKDGVERKNIRLMKDFVAEKREDNLTFKMQINDLHLTKLL